MTTRCWINRTVLTAMASFILLQVCHVPARAAQADTGKPPVYNFNYRIAGDRSVAPIQAFDDGKRLRLQFPNMNAIPAIFADTPAGKILLKWEPDPPFVVLPRIEPELLLVMNKRHATVSLAGSSSASIQPVMYGAKQGQAVNGQVQTPITPQEAIAQRRAAEATIRPSAPPASAPIAAAPAEPKVDPAIKTWEIKATDLSIYGAMVRWAKEADWQLSWTIPKDYPVEIVDSHTGTFEDAVFRVLDAYKVSEYPPWPCFHRNKVLRVVRRVGDGQECKR